MRTRSTRHFLDLGLVGGGSIACSTHEAEQVNERANTGGKGENWLEMTTILQENITL